MPTILPVEEELRRLREQVAKLETENAQLKADRVPENDDWYNSGCYDEDEDWYSSERCW